jgi:hypothetical protein
VNTNLASAARIGARHSGADPALLDSDELAAIAEEVIADVLALDEATLRDMMRRALMSSRHPTWFEGDPRGLEWRDSLVDRVAIHLKGRPPIDSLPKLRLVGEAP